ncbi:MAG: hypothetical protein EBZ48_13270, partial [Proteobacteria bacterium]|nr:hypothetical protein [Pseudomonadota bacterium]
MQKGVALLVLGICVGCSSSQGPELIASTSPLAPGVRGTVPASGSDCQTFLLGLIPVTLSPNTQQALSNAKSSAHAEVLTDVTVDENSIYWILFSHRCIRVRGLGVVDQSPAQAVA